jgi:hypothetical protein
VGAARVAEAEADDEVVPIGQQHGALQGTLLGRRQPDPEPVVDSAHPVAGGLARTGQVVDLPALVGQRADVALELVHRPVAVEAGDLGEPLTGLPDDAPLAEDGGDPDQSLHRGTLVPPRCA